MVLPHLVKVLFGEGFAGRGDDVDDPQGGKQFLCFSLGVHRRKKSDGIVDPVGSHLHHPLKLIVTPSQNITHQLERIKIDFVVESKQSANNPEARISRDLKKGINHFGIVFGTQVGKEPQNTNPDGCC